MKNSLKINNTSLHSEVWDILAAADNVSWLKAAIDKDMIFTTQLLV